MRVMRRRVQRKRQRAALQAEGLRGRSPRARASRHALASSHATVLPLASTLAQRVGDTVEGGILFDLLDRPGDVVEDEGVRRLAPKLGRGGDACLQFLLDADGGFGYVRPVESRRKMPECGTKLLRAGSYRSGTPPQAERHRTAARMPRRMSIGGGGQPGTTTSTGTTLATRPQVA